MKKQFIYKVTFIVAVFAVMFFIQSFIQGPLSDRSEKQSTVLIGTAPSLTVDNSKLYMSFASGDSILYCSSIDKGKNFSVPELVIILPNLSFGGGRGPQIVAVKDKLVIAAADKAGNIYTFSKSKNAKAWGKNGRISDTPEIAKEGFVSLVSGYKGELYAVWLDLRNNKKNKIVGAMSRDAGKTWTKNKIIYTSPDGTVCECCKPSVAMKGRLITVMFRNWLNGNRDLYVIQSADAGINFGKARKLGEGSWKLNACPMDGGGLVINNDNSVSTVWRRQGEIYSCTAGKKKKKIATGKQCRIAGNDSNSFIVFVNEGKVYCLKPGGDRVELGAGANPDVVATGTATALCVWQHDGQVHYFMITK